MKRITLAFIAVAMTACSSPPPRIPTEYDVVLTRPKPTTPEAQRQECSWIETSLERQKSLANYVTATSTYPAVALAYQDTTQRNMAVLNSRSQAISCQVAAGAQSFDQCFARCTQYTSRSKEQCFDACNR
ncbi:MAG: hypothetical protein JO292_09485 [Betaproteobacteria bacterium]|nr:hypothetical protein [Betaproteobacteria bacterium]